MSDRNRHVDLSDDQPVADDDGGGDQGAASRDRPRTWIAEDPIDAADAALGDATDVGDGSHLDRLSSADEPATLAGAALIPAARSDEAPPKDPIHNEPPARDTAAARGAAGPRLAARVLRPKRAMLAAGVLIIGAGLATAAVASSVLDTGGGGPLHAIGTSQGRASRAAAPVQPAASRKPAPKPRSTVHSVTYVHESRPGQNAAQAPNLQAPPETTPAQTTPAPATVASQTPVIPQTDSGASGSGTNVASSPGDLATNNAGSSGGGYEGPTGPGAGYGGGSSGGGGGSSAGGGGSSSSGGGGSSAGGGGGTGTTNGSDGGSSSSNSSSGGSASGGGSSGGGSGSASGTGTTSGGG
jgi:hypothetical protein